MRRVVLALVALVAVAAPVTVAAAPANAANNPPCMSRAEFKKIHVGMNPTRIKAIVGSSGRLTMNAGWTKIRQWKHCGSMFGLGQVSYTGGHVNNKLMI